MKVGIIVFPGSNCDHDSYWAVKEVLGQKSSFIWHRETRLSSYDTLILPGGFSYGDYLRSGAIAKFSPVMEEVRAFAADGKPVIGICNGFQILTESGLLPGALAPNDHLKFVCTTVSLKVGSTNGPWMSRYSQDSVVNMPIAHGEGRYVADPEILTELENSGRIAFRYCSADGDVNADSNPNGSMGNIAGILNEAGNVLGMMPHPERVVEKLLGGEDGRYLFESLMEVRA